MTPGPSPAPDATLPLRLGTTGPAVADLQARLRRAGTDAGDSGTYDERTAAAVRAFQERRGIRTDGICGRQTWAALVEAGWCLGDRLLFERRPMQRGDDVADLQSRLGGLGFLDDRVDGILGPRTRQALQDFQRNFGLTVDGICGPETIVALDRIGARTPVEVKAGVVERARLRATPRQLSGQRIVVGDLGGVGALADAVERALHDAGATVVVTSDPDGSHQAQEANALEADVYLGLTTGDAPRCAFYATDGFVSEGGARLASLVADAMARPDALDVVADVVGMRLPVLRETRMPAVMCELAPATRVVERGARLAVIVADAMGAWTADPLPAEA